MAFSDTTFTPGPGVFLVAIACRGSGGGGQTGGGPGYGNEGGGAGAYARKRGIAVIPGNSYLVRQALGTGGDGDDSLFITGAVVKAVGGHIAAFGARGLGGLASACVGDVVWSGGDSGFSREFFPAFQPSGSGGGGGGGPDSDGGVGAISAGGSGHGNGDGGSGGGGDNIVGSIGNQSGGGGGGGGGNFAAGANGADGSVAIYDDTGSPTDPYSGTPIYLVGMAPPAPAPPPSPKARKSARFM